MKSCAPIKSSSFYCHILGVTDGELFDRCFAVTTSKKEYFSARHNPKMILIQPKITENRLILSAPGKSDITVDLNKIKSKHISGKIACWHSLVDGIDAGNEVAEWLSDFIVDGKNSLRLYFYPYLHPTKGKSKDDNIYKSYLPEDAGTYHDVTSYMLIN